MRSVVLLLAPMLLFIFAKYFSACNESVNLLSESVPAPMLKVVAVTKRGTCSEALRRGR
jgi:hypothetical protein